MQLLFSDKGEKKSTAGILALTKGRKKFFTPFFAHAPNNQAQIC
jgi:hypothetical protein